MIPYPCKAYAYGEAKYKQRHLQRLPHYPKASDCVHWKTVILTSVCTSIRVLNESSKNVNPTKKFSDFNQYFLTFKNVRKVLPFQLDCKNWTNVQNTERFNFLCKKVIKILNRFNLTLWQQSKQRSWFVSLKASVNINFFYYSLKSLSFMN